MIQMTYLKELQNEEDTAVVTFEGDVLDIYDLIDYVKKYNSKIATTDTAEEDLVNHPSHYASHGMECILEMIMLYGFEETMSFCKLNSHKYRKRALDKNGRQDLDKSDWYIEQYRSLSIALENGLSPLQYVCMVLEDND